MSHPPLQIIPHLDYSEITQRCQNCRDAKQQKYWLAIQLLSDPNVRRTTEQVATAIGFSADWVRKLVHRYNRLGPDGLTEPHRGRHLRRN